MAPTVRSFRLARHFVVVVFAVSTVTTAVAQRETEPPSPLGRLIDIGGWRMHINCTGQAVAGQPTVILEAGSSDFSVNWSLVQPQVAAFGRVCSYDRSGSGWSDLGPYPHTMRQVVYELGTLLERAGERPPYVMVGHSIGGRYIRLFTADHRSDVAGMILVDANHEDDLMFINGELRREWEAATGQAVPLARTSMPLKMEDIPANIRTQIEAAAQQAGAGALDPPFNKLSPAAQEARKWAHSQPKWMAANNSTFTADEVAAMRDARRNTPYPLGDMPLIVVSRGIPITSTEGPRAAEREEERKQHQADLTTLSRGGRQVIAEHSGHHIHIDEPEVVVRAIRDVMTAIRR